MEFSLIILALINSIIKSQFWVGVRKMAPNIGLPETHGEATGEKEDSSESSEELITWQYKETARGPYLLTHGHTMFVTRPNKLNKLSIFNRNKL